MAEAANSPRFLVDPIFNTGGIHLISGPSGSGKTRWLWPMIEQWQKGLPVLGYPSHPQPFGYLVCDRPEDSTRATIASMRLDLPDFPLVALMDRDDSRSLANLPLWFPPSQVKVIFIEAFQTMMATGKINDYVDSWEFFRKVYRVCKAHNYTVIGTVHTPKVRQDEQYVRARDKVFGSAIWAACADTIIYIEQDNHKDISSSTRLLQLLPRNQPAQEFHFSFNDYGCLNVDLDAQIGDILLDQRFAKVGVGTELTKPQLSEWGEQAKLSPATLKRWIKRKEEAASLVRTSRGHYVKAHEN